MATPPSHRPDRRAWRPAFGYLALAMCLVGGAVAAWWPAAGPVAPAGPSVDGAAAVSASAAPSAPVLAATAAAAMREAPTASVAVAAASSAPRIPRVRDPNGDQTPDLADYVNDGEKPSMNDVLQRLHAAGVHTGLGAFNPPGTKPLRIGLAVPEDFPLPPGYVRHYQATDDGQRVEPILMFAPDYQPLGADGQPVPLPADRVVPPELAPPGLPIRRITVPTPATGP